MSFYHARHQSKLSVTDDVISAGILSPYLQQSVKASQNYQLIFGHKPQQNTTNVHYIHTRGRHQQNHLHIQAMQSIIYVFTVAAAAANHHPFNNIAIKSAAKHSVFYHANEKSHWMRVVCYIAKNHLWMQCSTQLNSSFISEAIKIKNHKIHHAISFPSCSRCTDFKRILKEKSNIRHA